MNIPITSELKLVDLVDEWLQRLRTEGRLEGTTINEYERVLRSLVVPAVGDPRFHGLTTDGLNAVLAALDPEHNRQRKAKVILGAMLDAAVTTAQSLVNPVRGSLSVSRPWPRTTAFDTGDLATSGTPCGDGCPRTGLGQGRLVTGRHHEIDARNGRPHRRSPRPSLSDIDLDAVQVAIIATIKTESGQGNLPESVSVPRAPSSSPASGRSSKHGDAGPAYGRRN